MPKAKKELTEEDKFMKWLTEISGLTKFNKTSKDDLWYEELLALHLKTIKFKRSKLLNDLWLEAQNGSIETVD